MITDSLLAAFSTAYDTTNWRCESQWHRMLVIQLEFSFDTALYDTVLYLALKFQMLPRFQTFRLKRVPSRSYDPNLWSSQLQFSQALNQTLIKNLIKKNSKLFKFNHKIWVPKEANSTSETCCVFLINRCLPIGWLLLNRTHWIGPIRLINLINLIHNYEK